MASKPVAACSSQLLAFRCLQTGVGAAKAFVKVEVSDLICLEVEDVRAPDVEENRFKASLLITRLEKPRGR
jgi:hypothetical protein